MIESDSLDRITLDSDDVQTLERFKNNYYNHKNNIMQKGGAPDNFLKEPVKEIIMLIFSKIKFSNKILLTFSQVSPATPARALPAPPARALSTSTARALPAPPPTQTSNTTPNTTQNASSKPTSTTQTERPWYQFWSGGNNKKKLKKNITRLYNCYILSLNQNGGTEIHNKLSLKIKKRLNKKITELKNLEGGKGEANFEEFFKELLTKSKVVIETNDEVKVYLKNSLQPIILQILNLQKHNILAQYISNNITNIMNKFPNLYEIIIWNFIQQTMEEKKKEINNEYDKFLKSKIGNKHNNVKGGNNNNLVGGTDHAIKTFLEIIIAIVFGIVISPIILIYIILKAIGLVPKEFKGHGEFQFWDQLKMTNNYSSHSHGRGTPY